MNTSTRIALILALIMVTSCASLKKSAYEPAKKDAPAAAAPAKATKKAAATPSAAGTAVCKHGSDERKLEIVPQASGCELHYTKMGKTDVVASAANGRSHCEAIFNRIQSKLVAAGHHCQ